MWTSPTLTPVFILVILAVKQIEGWLTYKTTLTVKTIINSPQSILIQTFSSDERFQ